MKKWVVLIMLLAVLAGCRSVEKNGTSGTGSTDSVFEREASSIETEIDQTKGLFDSIRGEAASDIKSVVSMRENGEKNEVKIEDRNFIVNTPAALNDKKMKIKVTFQNGSKSTIEVRLPMRAAIDSYDNFASQMNENMRDINEAVKTKFPSTVDEGPLMADDQNGVQTWITVQKGKLAGFTIIAKEDAQNELATIFSAFLVSYRVKEKLFSVFDDFLASRQGRTLTSDGYTFTFAHQDNTIHIDIIKTVGSIAI